jgi:hypothetical protein
VRSERRRTVAPVQSSWCASVPAHSTARPSLTPSAHLFPAVAEHAVHTAPSARFSHRDQLGAR